MTDCRLPKAAILRRKLDFERVLFRGRRRKQGPIALYTAPGPGPQSRAAFTCAGRRLSAPARNRIRRRLREIYRTNRTAFAPGVDIILRGDAAAADMEFAELRRLVLALAAESR